MTRTAVRPEANPRAAFRGDVEGLRALAVVLVLVGHASQQLVPGGFVGVDVFFVISGFLITGLLVAEVNRTGHLSLIGFYGRRAKRLLPAAVVVLIGTLLLTFAFLPRTRWSATGWDVVFSGLYAMNWRLAEQSVDYLAANRAPSILQHFWSLGVEEQFYLVWPLLLAAAVWLGRRRYARTGYLLIALTLVAVPSFAWSVWLTEDNPARAYFVTTTRMWELALGGFLALLAGHLKARRTPKAPASAGSGRARLVWPHCDCGVRRTSDGEFRVPRVSGVGPHPGDGSGHRRRLGRRRHRPGRAVGARAGTCHRSDLLLPLPLALAAARRRRGPVRRTQHRHRPRRCRACGGAGRAHLPVH
ncbi:acyltransferase [Micromonospora sp. WMMD961]|uniref:acyltransferase family protein n=1 Tax=Micromonospora sp. WMMD961 TaxID=3016100 RepID=UPI002416A192|nr:acyltransferase [Micromonospora sp. WMMD961]MDG4780375.1 acyltransferase [Micromonospora sp. WMMD961]